MVAIVELANVRLARKIIVSNKRSSLLGLSVIDIAAEKTVLFYPRQFVRLVCLRVDREHTLTVGFHANVIPKTYPEANSLAYLRPQQHQ